MGDMEGWGYMGVSQEVGLSLPSVYSVSESRGPDYLESIGIAVIKIGVDHPFLLLSKYFRTRSIRSLLLLSSSNDRHFATPSTKMSR